MLAAAVVIASAGIAGSALATVFAHAGPAVLVLEKETLLAAFTGPDAMPAEAFDPSVRARLLAPA